jgi:phage tail tape-measure protein
VTLRQVAFEAPAPQVTEKKAKKGGGAFGQAAGAVVGGAIGAAAGMATGGAATAQGALVGASAGGALGQTIGNMADPARSGSTAMARRAELAQPEMIQSDSRDKIKEALLALHQQPPEIKQEYAPVLLNAYLKSHMPGGGVA